MSRILIAWELGSGLGHVGPLRAIGSELVRRGHTVAIAAANTELCRQALAGTGVATLRSPILPYSTRRLKFPCTYSDMLHDCGYASAENLTAATGAWLRLFDDFRPNLLLADHSPTALVAGQTRDFATAAIGTGFLCPPDISPLPSLRSDIPEPHWAEEVEQAVLANMNAALATHGGVPLARVAEIFGRADRQYLLTLSELDHYRGWRGKDPRETTYWPPVGTLPGRVCDWPTGPTVSARPRVFVYLHTNETLLPILRGLAYKRISTICIGPHLSDNQAADIDGSSVRVSTSPIDLSPLRQGCTAAVLHGGHGTVCELLRSGVPMLLLPLMLEQRITAERLAELHVGLDAPLDDLNAAAAALEVLLEDSSYQDSARSLAQRLAHVNETTTIGQLADDIEALAATR